MYFPGLPAKHFCSLFLVYWFFFTVQFGYQAGRLYKPANQIAEKGFPGKRIMIVFVVFVSFSTMKSLFFISKSRLLTGSKESQFYSLPFGQAVACMTSPKAISSGELARRLVVIFRRPMQQREGRGFQPELICDFFMQIGHRSRHLLQEVVEAKFTKLLSLIFGLLFFSTQTVLWTRLKEDIGWNVQMAVLSEFTV